MTSLANLIPSPGTLGLYVPRPAAIEETGFSGFVSPNQVSAMLVVGYLVYGMIGETGGSYSGKDVPFVYNLQTQAFLALTGVNAAALPNTLSLVGDWVPPTMALVSTRVIVTHNGFAGGPQMIGWFDISNFVSSTATGSTHGSTILDTLSTNVLQLGWAPGMTITGNGINTTIQSIAVGGLSLVLSAPAIGTNSGVALTVRGGTTTTPQWAAGTTNGNALVSKPLAVYNFNGRAYYAVGPGVQFSDSLIPTQITNANQALTAANGIPVTAFGGLPFSQTTGGILQALICFQGDAEMLEITGDYALQNLGMNNLGIGVGCLAPNTICQTDEGLAFIAPDGMRVINFFGNVSTPMGAYGEGVLNPFLFALNPTRMCAAYNQNVYRVSVQNGNPDLPGQPQQEYWYDRSLKKWSGPHTFSFRLIEAYQEPSGANIGYGFIGAPINVTASLWSSGVNPTTNSTYTEDGTLLSWVWQTVLLPDNDKMCENAMVESALMIALPANVTVTVQPLNETGSPLDTVYLQSGLAPATQWGSFTWGHAVWEGQPGTNWDDFIWGAAAWGEGLETMLQQTRLSWEQPIVFKQMSMLAVGTSVPGLAIGNLYMKYQELGYMLQGTT